MGYRVVTTILNSSKLCKQCPSIHKPEHYTQVDCFTSGNQGHVWKCAQLSHVPVHSTVSSCIAGISSIITIVARRLNRKDVRDPRSSHRSSGSSSASRCTSGASSRRNPCGRVLPAASTHRFCQSGAASIVQVTGSLKKGQCRCGSCEESACWHISRAEAVTEAVQQGRGRIGPELKGERFPAPACQCSAGLPAAVSVRPMHEQSLC